MIAIDNSDPDFVVLCPEGALTEADFASLAGSIDGRINETDRIPNLVIRVDKLPYWASLGALTSHLHFVHEHQKIIAKVAIVGDSPLLTLAPEIANHFTRATIRRFPAKRLEDAKAWARAAGDDPGRFDEIPGLPGDVVAIRAVGIITAQDYKETLVPLVEEKLKTHDKLKCLCVLGDDWTTYSGDAAWSDTLFGLRHGWKFSRVALVTDIKWVARAALLFAPLMRAEFKAFPVAELEEAKAWIRR